MALTSHHSIDYSLLCSIFYVISNYLFVERREYFVERSDRKMERNDLERRDRIPRIAAYPENFGAY